MVSLVAAKKEVRREREKKRMRQRQKEGKELPVRHCAAPNADINQIGMLRDREREGLAQQQVRLIDAHVQQDVG